MATGCPGTGSPSASVTVTVASTVDVPSAGTVGEESANDKFAGAPYWVSVAWPDTPWPGAFAVIVDRPGLLVEVTVVVYVPFASVVPSGSATL